jgi:hypothetical protein
MSRQPPVDPVPHLAAVAKAAAEGEGPPAVFTALDGALAATLGHKLFTALLFHAATGESERFYTNQPKAYPIGGRKPLNPTFWAKLVIEGRRPYLGRTAADIKAVFFDHALIDSLGCRSVINLPVVEAGKILGTLNILHEEQWYDETDFALGSVFAALAVPAFRRLLSR